MTDTVWTPAADERLRAYLARPGYTIPQGLGTAEAACSVAAINLALTGTLTDDIPPCMSVVIGQWLLRVQDAMPEARRNSSDWRELLPQAAGTGREREAERLAVVLEWLWGTVLPHLQLAAAAGGYGEEWAVMCAARSPAAAGAAAGAATGAAARAAAWAAWAATRAAGATGDATGAATRAAARAAAWAAWAAAWDAARAAAWAAWAAAWDAAWAAFDPTGLLQRLIAVD